MLYYSNEARISHIKRITELIEVIDNIPADILGGCENVSDIHKYLVQYKEVIQRECKLYEGK